MLNVRRPMGRLLFWMLLMVMAGVSVPRALGAGPATTTVSDVIYRADGAPAQGTLLISWPAFATKTGIPVAAGSKSVKIGTGGAVSIPLVPNTGAAPTGTHYTVVLKLADGTTSTEFWSVPDAGTATVAAIRSKIVPATAAAQFVARDYVDSALAGISGDFVVHKGGVETITGTKTFALAPLVPQPSVDGEAANKAYVDSRTGGGDVSVREFGAKGDGSTDDTAAIQAAIDTACDSGGTIRFAQGVYKVTQTILVNSARCSHGPSWNRKVKLLGSGGFRSAVLMWYGANGGDMIREGAAGNANAALKLEVDGLGFMGADAAHGAVGINLYFGMSHSVRNSWFGDNLTNGIQGRGFYTSEITHNWFAGPTQSCVYFPNDDASASVNGNFLTYNEFAGGCGRYAIENVSQGAGGSNGNVYAFNDFEQCGPSGTCLGTVVLTDSFSGWYMNRREEGKQLASNQHWIEIRGSGNVFSGGWIGSIKVSGINNTFVANNWSCAGADGGCEFTDGNNTIIAPRNLAKGALKGTGAPYLNVQWDDFAQMGSGFSFGATDPQTKTASLKLVTSRFSSANANPDYANPTYPAPDNAGAMWNQSDVIWNRTAGYNLPPRSGFVGWVCTSSTCSWDGTAWTGSWAEFGDYHTRTRREGTAAPTSGTWRAGDFMWNTAPNDSSKILGWLCTIGGTPGTWQAIAGGSGGGSSLSVTTKGDLQTFGTTASRLPVGADNSCLIADSTQALGLKWGSCGSGGGSVSYPLLATDGSKSAPSFAFAGATNTGWYRYPGTTSAVLSVGGNPVLTATPSQSIRVPNNYAFGWSSTSDATVGADTGLSRCAANTVCIGNGNASDASGTLKMSKIQWTAASTPASSSDVCSAGQAWYDANYLYVCTATNQIKRVALGSF